MTAQQLINQLQALVKRNPKAAHKPVVMSQYDSEESRESGYEKAESVEDGHSRVIIA